MFDFYRVSAGVPDLRVADIPYNMEQIRSKIEEAKHQGACLIAFPELAVTGYTCGDLFFQHALIDASNNAICTLAKDTRDTNLIITLGAPVHVNNQLFNAAITMYKGKIYGISLKTFLPNYNEFYEKRWFSSGEVINMEEVSSNDIFGDAICEYKIPIGNNLAFEVPGKFKMAVEICEDVWAPLSPSTWMALAGAELIINISASNETIGKREFRRDIVKNKSAQLNCAYLYVSAGSGESTTDLVFSGHSLVAENGKILKENSNIADNDFILSCDIDFGRIRSDRTKGKTFFDTYKAYGMFVPQKCIPLQKTSDIQSSDATLYSISAHPFIPSNESKRQERCKAIFEMQVAGLRKRLSVTGSKMVIGVSGGMDSTLSLLVAAQTLRKMNRPMSDLIGITMPAFGTTDRTYQNALKLMDTLGISVATIPIKEACTLHYRDIGHDISIKDVTFENVQARERTQVLMDYANRMNAIVVGTGDLSELALGWCTYNADQMSMYGVNASIPKTLVRWLIDSVVKYNLFPDSSDVLKDIIDTPISPELLPPDENGKIAQKTEDVVGPYELHDFYLYYMMRFGYTPSKIFAMAQIAFCDKYDKDTILKWMKVFYRRFFTQQFKRSCMPDGVKVGSICLSPRGDFRMPSDAVSKIWLSELDKL
ncbi:MAG: NAD(+) synthase [Eubacteriales bacterium]|nr:NAD(+) synthase [Eubacteriales bacterium]